MEEYSASIAWPASIVPVSKMVTEATTGTATPRSCRTWSTAISPAFNAPVSKQVSISRKSAPPSIRALAWS